MDFPAVLWFVLGSGIVLFACANFFIFILGKQKDRHKIIVGIGFIPSSVTFFIMGVTENSLVFPNLFVRGLYYWGIFPLFILILTAIFERLFHLEKKFDVLFKIYLSLFVLTLLFCLSNFYSNQSIMLGNQLFATVIFVMSIVLLLKTRDISSMFFLLSMFFFAIAGFTLGNYVDNTGIVTIYFPILSFYIGFLFLIVIFSLISKMDKAGSMTAYFSLEKQLKSAAEALRMSEEKYQKIVENTDDVVVLTDAAGKIMYVSPAAEKTYGYSPDDLMRNHDDKIFPKDRQVLNELNFKSEQDQGETVEYQIETSEGIKKWVSHSWSPIFEDNRLMMNIHVIKDIDNQKQFMQKIQEKVVDLRRNELATLSIMEDLHMAQEKVRLMNIELEKKVKERTAQVEHLLYQKDDFINQLGHDLKNPLNPLVNLLPVLEKSEEDPKRKEILDILNRNAGYMKNLVIKTIDLAKLNSSKTVFNFQNTNLLNEMDSVLENNKLHLAEHHITVENKIDSELMVHVDTLRLEELINNLLSNAIKYSADYGKITINAVAEESQIKVSIKDTGIGMTSEQLDKVFDEFYKADPARHDFDSSGLGMPICKKIVEKHGGKIWAESNGPNQGSVIYFTLPAAQ